MFKLQQKVKEEATKREESAAKPTFSKMMSVRSTRLTKEYPELDGSLPGSCEIEHDDANDLRNFKLIVRPAEGYWKGGKFVFDIKIPSEYNMKPPLCSCLTKLWHPNITEDGKICLSVLRENSLDASLGWSPVRTLKDVVIGLSSLFTDLLNFDDPLNVQAAEHFALDPDDFVRKVTEYVNSYAQDD
ncbi:NEDD8-conjugating enzyme UBE2F-like [Oopsacas minuta]|uniref:E2 NEDD8-conjugating enzyme n=1 Tax=Oopsacas minuta TaxID=111878 RepID=A0AAV7JY06_9METZ|nr:NEDD8-conjugating enzyme UBE2F-like [Oopsacas minuta]